LSSAIFLYCAALIPPPFFKVVRAFTEALHFIKTNKEETKALIGKNLKSNDPEGLERAYRAYNGAFPEIPYPNAEGVKTLLDDMAPRTPKAATADRYESGSGTGNIGVYQAAIQKIVDLLNGNERAHKPRALSFK
jgi:hypothetical protein